MRGAGIRVLIVGAGVAGPAATRTLRSWGAAVEVVEVRPGPATAGTGIYLPGNAVRALDAVGLGDAVTERAVRIRRQHTADARGRVLVDLDADELWRGVGPCLALPRAELAEVLLAGIGDIPVRWGTAPRAIVPDGDGVSVELDDGRTDRFDLVIGADGVHSTVRRLVVDEPAVRPLGQDARRFLAPGDDRDGTWSVQLGPGSAFLTIPVGGDRVYCYCDGPAADPRPLPELLAGYAEPVPTMLDVLARNGLPLQAGPVEEVVLGSWSRGRVLLVGDAAHATSPNMAQGAAMAVEDAIVLAESLAAAGSVDAGLAVYEHRRRPRTDWVRRQTHRRDRARTLHPAVRGVVLRAAGRRMFRGHHRLLRDRP